MNVLEYFDGLFPGHEHFHNQEILAEMPLDSACGDDCRACIDRAVSFVESIRMAYGDKHKPHHIRNVLYAAVDVCVCYIRG